MANTPLQLHPRLVLDDSGKPSDVMLSLDEFRSLLEALEDQIDARDLDEAVQNAGELIPLEEVIAEMEAEGLL